jgi:murein DD-endopeptidase MepM/ murein hydrolase activator NlpD
MAVSAESIVFEFVGETSGLVAPVASAVQSVTGGMGQMQRSATAFESTIRSAAAGAGASTAAMAQGFSLTTEQSRKLGFQIADIGSKLIGGTSPFVILAEQAPRMAAEFAGATGAAGRMAGVLSGPWGAVLIGAGAALGELAFRSLTARSELEQATSELERNARKAAITEQAQQVFANTLEGVTEAMRRNRQALEQLDNQHKTAARRALESALASRLRLINTRNETAAIIAQTEAELERQRATRPMDESALTHEVALGMEDGRLTRLRQTLAETDTAIAESLREIREARSRRIVELAEEGAAGRIHNDYRQRIEQAREQAVAERGVNNQLYRRVELLGEERDAALRANQARETRLRQERTGGSAPQPGGEAQFIRPVPGVVTSGYGRRVRPRPGASEFHPAVDFHASMGTTVVAPAGGVIIRTGRNDGLGEVVWIDHGNGTISELNHLTRATVERGQVVTQGQAVALSGNTGVSTNPHVDWRVRVGANPDGSAGNYVNPLSRNMRFPANPVAAAASAASVAQQRQQEERTFREQLAQYDAAILQARQRSAESGEERFRLETQEIEATRARQEAIFRQAETDHKIDRTLRDDLIAKNDELAVQLSINAQIREWQRLDEERYQIAVGELRSAAEMERARGQLARTVGQRRDSELRLLALAEKEELGAIARRRQQEGLTTAQLGQIDRDEANARERFGYAREHVARTNMTPLQQFLDRVPQSAEEMNEALEGIAARGLDSIANGLVDAISGTRSLGDAFKNMANQIIADLARIAIQRAIVSALGSIFGVGLDPAAKLGTAIKPTGVGPIMHAASGGAFMVGGRPGIDQNLLSINGQPRAMVSANELLTITPQGRLTGGAAGMAASPAASAGAVQRVDVFVHPSGEFDARVEARASGVAVQVVQAAAPGIVRESVSATSRTLSRPRLNR